VAGDAFCEFASVVTHPNPLMNGVALAVAAIASTARALHATIVHFLNSANLITVTPFGSAFCADVQ
jgi:hypothetical protein